ncbi:hypothetical protein BDF14DRAFT_1727917 [Spinellus fusiger]|nr:hypothetical protein BDF14DRAFT_1727917 [Spinellus fusiger]
MSRKDLADHLSWLTTPKDFQSICQPPTPGLWRSYVRRSRCEEYTHFGAMAWTDLHDFTSLAPHVRIQHHTIVSLPALQRTLGLTDKDTWVHSDRQLYDWRLYQDPKEAKAVMSNGSNYVDSFTGRHYYKVMDLDPWQQRPERLLQLGGVFGSTRLVLRHPEHLALQRTIALALHYRRDTPLGTTVQAIVDHLGGVGTFLSLHFRTGDAPFRSQLGGNLETMIRTMAAMTGAPVMLPADTAPKDKNTATDRSLSFWRLSAIQSQPRFHLTPPRDLTSLPWADFCSGVPANRSIAMDSINARALVYIATDYENPRGNESRLLPWYDHFPCTVTLQDIPVSLLDGLDQVKDVVDPTKSLRSFLLPLVDAMVAAHAREILTTPRSTYSRYIASLNQAWVPRDPE